MSWVFGGDGPGRNPLERDEDDCSHSTSTSKRCVMENGKMNCKTEKKVFKYCPGKPPQLVESFEEENHSEGENGLMPEGFEPHELPFESAFEDMSKMMDHFWGFSQIPPHHPNSQHPNSQHPHSQHPHSQHPHSQHPHSQHPHSQPRCETDPFALRRRHRNNPPPPNHNNKPWYGEYGESV